MVGVGPTSSVNGSSYSARKSFLKLFCFLGKGGSQSLLAVKAESCL